MCPAGAKAVDAGPGGGVPKRRLARPDSPFPEAAASRGASLARANARAASQAGASQRAGLALAGSRGRGGSPGRPLRVPADGRGAVGAVAVAVAGLHPVARNRERFAQHIRIFRL